MKTIEIHTSTGHCVVAPGQAKTWFKRCGSAGKRLVITDNTVHHFYGDLFSDLEVISLLPGEESKSLRTVEALHRKFLELEVDRSALIIAVGGGVVTDIAGYAAATYMRGVPFGFLPTTLVGQVDAALGGKNGVNLDGYKNIIGTFKQPQFVLIDIDFLQTLPEREVLCGAAEIIKHALIDSRDMFAYLEKTWRDILSLDPVALEKAIGDSAAVKMKYVEDDVEDMGIRRKLNFGHTLGHALETTCRIRHGEAVSLGMIFASRLSLSRGLLNENDVRRIEALLANFGLPTRLGYDPAPVIDAVRRDKKRRRQDIHFVLLEGLGQAVTAAVPFEELEEHIHDLCQSG